MTDEGLASDEVAAAIALLVMPADFTHFNNDLVVVFHKMPGLRFAHSLC